MKVGKTCLLGKYGYFTLGKIPGFLFVADLILRMAGKFKFLSYIIKTLIMDEYYSENGLLTMTAKFKVVSHVILTLKMDYYEIGLR